MRTKHKHLDSLLKQLGPGLITGAADDDPSGIATYSQAGAQFGLGMLWSVVFTYPLMVSIQLIGATIAEVTGEGLTAHIRHHYSRWLLYGVVGLLFAANTINIAADLSAMGDALKLIIGGPSQVYAAGFGLVSLVLQVFIPYRRYVPFLKWLTLALLAYVATVFVVRLPWGEVLGHTFFPDITWNRAYVTTLVAVFGTTISPYMFFWQASQEVEDQKANPLWRALMKSEAFQKSQLRRIGIDTCFGMGFSNLVAFFIILTTAATLHAHGITDIQSSAQAALALRPIAGHLAFLLFSLGIIGTGMLAIPILAGSAAYAAADAFHWRSSLELKPRAAKRFYGVITVSIVLGVVLGFTRVDPIRALYWSAVINGVISVPIMAIMLLMASHPKIMGKHAIGMRLKSLGWFSVGVMLIAVSAMFWLN